MMMRWWIAGTCVCCAVGCAEKTSSRQASAPPEAKASSRSGAPAAAPKRAAATPAVPVLDEQFAVSRQVTALERSIELYETFIVRAGDDPRYAEAVARSRARIADAKGTICFLLEKSCEDAEKP